jgi:archaellum component FlaC
MRTSLRTLVLFLVAIPCLLVAAVVFAAGQSGSANPANSDTTTTTKKATAKTATAKNTTAATAKTTTAGTTKTKKKTATKAPTVSEQLQQVSEQLKQQQNQIQQQQSQIQQLQQTNTQLQSQVQQQGQSFQNSVQEASQKAATAQDSVNSLHTTVTDLQSTTQASAKALLESKKSVDALENPLAIHYKGITITPGGWVESTFLVRSRNENADITSNFGSVPFDGVANSNLSEFRGSARGSRPIVVATGMAGSTKLTGYLEMDFLGQAPTSNQVETNSLIPRQRQLWMQAEFKNGLTFTAGQFWSLMTTDRKGIATRAEFIPTTLEGSYVVGYTYVRQNAIRVNKNFNNKIWAAAEIANSETTLSTSYTPSNLMGFNTSANALSPNGSTLNYLAAAPTASRPTSLRTSSARLPLNRDGDISRSKPWRVCSVIALPPRPTLRAAPTSLPVAAWVGA